jgi:hypothetical protein
MNMSYAIVDLSVSAPAVLVDEQVLDRRMEW